MENGIKESDFGLVGLCFLAQCKWLFPITQFLSRVKNMFQFGVLGGGFWWDFVALLYSLRNFAIPIY